MSRCWLCWGVIDHIGRVFNLDLYFLFFVIKRCFFFIPNNCDKGYLDIYIVLSQASARNIRPHDALHFDPHLSYLFTGKYHFLGYEPIFKIQRSYSVCSYFKMVYFHQWVDSWTHKTLKGREKINLHFHIIGKRRGQESSTSKIR